MADNKQKIKCVIWDLDNTLWNGVLLEDKNVFLRKDIPYIIKTLDQRGILQSIASRNDFSAVKTKLEEFKLFNYFLYPQINWNTKSDSIKKIAKSINIGIDTIAFVDDQEFEREEVAFYFPRVLCLDACDISKILGLPQMNPRFISADSKKRRKMYQSDIVRNQLEETFMGSKEDFLRTLNMRFSISVASEEDLKRAEELTVRTHQLNTTGYTYSYDELNKFRQSDTHKLLISELEDKYGSYGKIGLALIETSKEIWKIKLLLMSCRVMSRGVGIILINFIRKEAKKYGVNLLAEFIENDRNRMMYMTYKLNGFSEIEKQGDVSLFKNDLSTIPEVPDYLKISINQSNYYEKI